MERLNAHTSWCNRGDSNTVSSDWANGARSLTCWRVVSRSTRLRSGHHLARTWVTGWACDTATSCSRSSVSSLLKSCSICVSSCWTRLRSYNWNKCCICSAIVSDWAHYALILWFSSYLRNVVPCWTTVLIGNSAAFWTIVTSTANVSKILSRCSWTEVASRTCKTVWLRIRIIHVRVGSGRTWIRGRWHSASRTEVSWCAILHRISEGVCTSCTCESLWTLLITIRCLLSLSTFLQDKDISLDR